MYTQTLFRILKMELQNKHTPLKHMFMLCSKEKKQQY